VSEQQSNKHLFKVVPSSTLRNIRAALTQHGLNMLSNECDSVVSDIDATHFPVISASTWPTFTLNRVLGPGKWYYECTILVPGCSPQMGWADAGFETKPNNGVGDDCHSWACDGERVSTWHSGDEEHYGQEWGAGDTVGFAADIARATDGSDALVATLSFSLNGNWENPWGVAFQGARVVGGLSPALSPGRGSRIRLCLCPDGALHQPPDSSYMFVGNAETGGGVRL
jgi:hypothetical protein